MPTVLDVIIQPLYDHAFIPTAGTQLLTFFSQPIGSGVSMWFAAGTKTSADTNMTTASALPAGYNFVVQGVRLVPSFNMTIADATLALNGAVFTFFIGSKDYLVVPARFIPAGCGPYIGGAGATTVAGWGMPVIQNGFKIGNQPLELAQTQNFGATLKWPSGGQAVTTTMANGTTVGVAGLPIAATLDGVLKRLPQ